jgi:hypothetical protein
MNRLNLYQMHQLHQIASSKGGKHTLQFRSWIDILHIRCTNKKAVKKHHDKFRIAVLYENRKPRL